MNHIDNAYWNVGYELMAMVERLNIRLGREGLSESQIGTMRYERAILLDLIDHLAREEKRYDV